jgi:hypothetical protein
MTTRDVDFLTRRLRSLERCAARIASHVDDLHALAYEPGACNSEPDRTGFESRPPPGWRPETTRAQELWGVLIRVVGNSEAAIVELERQVLATFFAGSISPEPSRGSLISVAEHDQLLARQRARASSARIVDQPPHPGRQR